MYFLFPINFQNTCLIIGWIFKMDTLLLTQLNVRFLKIFYLSDTFSRKFAFLLFVIKCTLVHF